MQIIGHRGARGYSPENTLASFQKAIAMGVDMIELDVYVLKSGELVVMHDDTVDRTTNGTGHIEQYDLIQLRQLDAGNGQRIPLLTEVLDLLNKRLPVNIELKGQHTAKPVAKLLRHYTTKKGWSPGLFLVSSFNHPELQKFVALMPAIRVGALFEDRPTHYTAIAQSDNAFSANMAAPFVTGRSVKEAHSHGLKVFAYTVNTRSEARRMRTLKVDGIFTDYPDRVRRYVAH